MRRRHLLSLAMTIALVFGGCEKQSQNEQSTNLHILLSDNPLDATAVNIDIREVKINYQDQPDGWITVPTRAGIYNLLDYQHGLDTLLAAGPVPLGPVSEIRFVLGNQNSIEVDDILYPLTVPSGSTSGLKIKLQHQLQPVADTLHLDFDAALSVHQTGNGKYMLQPVIRPLW